MPFHSCFQHRFSTKHLATSMLIEVSQVIISTMRYQRLDFSKQMKAFTLSLIQYLERYFIKSEPL